MVRVQILHMRCSKDPKRTEHRKLIEIHCVCKLLRILYQSQSTEVLLG